MTSATRQLALATGRDVTDGYRSLGPVAFGGQGVPKRLVRPALSSRGQILTTEQIQVPGSEYHEVVQTLLLDRIDEPFDEGIHHRHL